MAVDSGRGAAGNRPSAIAVAKGAAGGRKAPELTATVLLGAVGESCCCCCCGAVVIGFFAAALAVVLRVVAS